MKIAPSVMMIKLVWILIKNLVEKCVKKFVKGTIHNRHQLICHICQVTPQDTPRVPSCISPGVLNDPLRIPLDYHRILPCTQGLIETLGSKVISDENQAALQIYPL